MKLKVVAKRLFTALVLLTILFFTTTSSSTLYVGLFAIFISGYGVKEFTMIRTKLLEIINIKEKEIVDPRPPAINSYGLNGFVQTWCRIIWASLYPFLTYYFDYNTYEFIRFSSFFCFTTLLLINCLYMFGIFNYNKIGRFKGINAHNFIAAQLDYFAICFFGGSVASVVSLFREAPYYPILICGTIAACDGGGLWFGKQFAKRDKNGKPKNPLHNQLSPNKSIEGVVGSILMSMLAGFVTQYIFVLIGNIRGEHWDYPHSHLFFITMGFIYAVVGIVGDLFESFFKRVAYVKDSGTVFGAHGGVCDRFDATIFGFPCAFIIYYLGFEKLFR